jgi:hypothetical protein
MNMVKLLVIRDGWFHPSEALEIIERARTRVFIEQLALTSVLIESSLDPEFRARERQAIADIQRLTTSLRVTQQLETTQVQTRLIMANELAQAQQGLQELWNAPGVSDQYLDLRRGQPISFEQLRHLLMT